ncbi:hypothetical protein [Streptomyces sp. NPDC091215]|uniref:hypothetical protein n=1 Tax=Streptomyces sp. NPDC091215 TaxID=3155192 RepID=UPI0034187ECD
MAWATKLPAAISRLVTVFSTWPGLADVTVVDGPTLSKQTFTEVVTVGWTGGEDDADAEATISPEGAGGSPDREQFTIRCAAAVLLGSDDVPGARARAYDLLSEAGAALAANRTLNGLVLRAMVGSHSLTQDRTQQGTQATVVFEVSCDAYTDA